MKKLMIFDLDGTLFNTDEVNFKSYEKALNIKGFDLDHDRFVSEFNGKSYKFFLPIITKDAPLEIIEEIHNLKKDFYSEYLSYAKVNEHLFSIIESNKKDYYMVVVTTGSKKNTYEILNYFSKAELFDDIITAEDYKKTKPDPEGFLTAMKKYKMEGKDTVIYEDSDVGIEAALKTDASVFVIERF